MTEPIKINVPFYSFGLIYTKEKEIANDKKRKKMKKVEKFKIIKLPGAFFVFEGVKKAGAFYAPAY